jgi:hypothetical protein
MKCATCDTENPRFRWTDTHGVAQCGNCGTPHRVYHYDDKSKPLDLPPESIVSAEYVPALREHWKQTGRIIPSGCSFSYSDGYEMASKMDAEDFSKWMEANAEKYKVAQTSSPQPSQSTEANK